MKLQWLAALGAALCALLLAVWPDGGGRRSAAAVVPEPRPASSAVGSLQPLPPSPPADPRKVALGKRLFHDPRLSGDGTIACAHCHDLRRGGTDRLERSIGIGGAVGDVNAPTVLNSGLSFRQFWDGRAETLEDQVDGPLQSPKEMGSTWPQATAALSQVPEYRALFGQIYPDGITPDNVRNAIASYERSLTTPDSPFDRYLRGEVAALGAEEQRGHELFKSLGCQSCHQGVGIGGNMYQRLGIMADYFADRGRPTQADNGRFNVTGNEEDRHLFKVPSLRNVELTPPYFHDGSAPTLEAAVEAMAHYQLGRRLATGERQAIVAFLKSLTGQLSETALP